MFALIALKLVRHPEERAENDGAIVTGQVDDAGFDDQPAEFDQMSRALAALDLPCSHIMPRLRRLMTVARHSVAPKRHQCRG